jgi:hypothetical protein
MMNKQSPTADRVGPPGSGLGEELTTSLKKRIMEKIA